MKARSLLWLVVPALAVIAFAPVLGMWFVGDDFQHLLLIQRLPFPSALFTFKDDLFYRPFSTILTWNLERAIFGMEALPYHAVSLAGHALVAFLLARFAYTVSGSKATAWIAGALF